MIQKKKLTMPFWLRDLFSFSWRPATPADILRAWELLKDKSGYISVASGTCAVEVDEVQQLQYFSTVRSDMRIMASLAALHSSSWGAGEGHRKAMFHK